MESKAELKNIKKIFLNRSKKRVEALGSISLKIKEKEFLCIVGPSGCGKSTLLKIIGGIIKPTKGDIIFKQNFSSPKERQRFGLVFQKPLLLPWRNVIQNVQLPLELKKQSLENSRKKVKDILKHLSLEDIEDRLPMELSGGMQQKVSIARALVYEPNILLMDEPFSALDEINREKLNLELLRTWKKLGQTVVYVTHSIQEAVFLADRVVVLSDSPSKVKGTVDIDLKRPRTVDTKYKKKYLDLVKKVSKVLKSDVESK